jgi:hypothetical protein
MLRSAPPVSSFSIHIKDHALVLFLPQPEQQSLWRFDLDGLIEQAFRLTGREGYYFLTLDDLDGNSKIIARFVDKGQAESVINGLYDALTQTSSSEVSESVRTTPSRTKQFWSKWFGWLTFWRFVFLAALGLLLWQLFKPVSVDPVARRIAQQSAPVLPPMGTPLDADELLQ